MTILTSLCRTNLGILSQKVALMDVLIARKGVDGAKELYKSVCPMVGASMGQHVRHSMDHMELAILVADPSHPSETEDPPDIHYDLRVRGGTAEHDMDEARKRIDNVSTVLRSIASGSGRYQDHVWDPVRAHFMLSGDGQEFELQSSIGRELGFAAHHAIHHMATVKLIAVHHAGLDEKDLPADFGRAPSTVHHDHQQEQQQQ